MKIKVGQTLTSPLDGSTVVVVRAGDGEFDLRCGGIELIDPKAPPAATAGFVDPSLQSGTLLGKRYADEETGVELLCTKGGSGTLTVNGAILPQKAAKPLPASD